MKLRYRLAACWLLLFVGTCSATPPLMDQLEYEGEWNIVTPKERPWLNLRENEKTQEIRRQARCSAIGAPRAKWRVSDGRLWLVGLFQCGGDIKLESVYGGNGEPIFADWVTADLMTQRGKTLCRHRYGYGGAGILETSVFIRVERGVVAHIAQVSNQNNPAIPTVDSLRKLFGPKDAHMAEEAVADWPCFEPSIVRELKLDQSGESPPKVITFGEYLNDHARKLFRSEKD
jgi:hypothetical protein